MIKSFFTFGTRFGSKKAPSIGEVRKCWGDYSQMYNKFDYTPQTFFYSFLYMTHIWKAKNILQVACGCGKLLPVAMQLKQNDAKYLATDLSPQMIETTKINLKHNFDKYQSKLQFQEWLETMNLTIKVANGQEPMLKERQEKFDRIICNCVLMLTSDAEKMLKNLYQCAAPGCLLGVSVWGNKSSNNFMAAMRDSILQSGFPLPEERSNFYLYKKVEDLAEKSGWKIVLNWEQNALFPIINMADKQNEALFFHQIEKLPQEQQQKVKEVLLAKLQKQMQQKKGFNFSCQMLVLQKQ